MKNRWILITDKLILENQIQNDELNTDNSSNLKVRLTNGQILVFKKCRVGRSADFSNDQYLVDQSYSNRPSCEKISNQ